MHCLDCTAFVLAHRKTTFAELVLKVLELVPCFPIKAIRVVEHWHPIPGREEVGFLNETGDDVRYQRKTTAVLTVAIDNARKAGKPPLVQHVIIRCVGQLCSHDTVFGFWRNSETAYLNVCVLDYVPDE